MTHVRCAGRLDGVHIPVATPPGTPGFASTVTTRTTALGATAERVDVEPAGDEIEVPPGVDVLVWDRVGAA